MRIESELYVLFRVLVKFLKNESFLEFYQQLGVLKDAIKSTLQTLLDFGVILTGKEKFASEKTDLSFFQSLN